MVTYQNSIDLKYFNKLVLRSLSIFLSDKTSMFVPTGLELIELQCVCKDQDYFNNIFGPKNNPPAFYSPINNIIYLNYQHNLFNSVKNNELRLLACIMFILFHEANHSLLFHARRKKTRDQIMWNIACDYEIHNILYTLNSLYKNDEYNTAIVNVMKTIACDNHTFLFDEQYLSLTAEEIYDDICKNNDVCFETISGFFNPINETFSKQKNTDDDCPCNINQVTYTKHNKQISKYVFIEFPDLNNIPERYKQTADQVKTKQQNSELKRILLENSIRNNMQNVGIGELSNKFTKLLNKLFAVKVNWQNILKNSLHNVLEKSDTFSWAKPRMISLTLPDINYLPDVEMSDNGLGTVVISRDESGSMSDESLQHISNIINDAKEYYKEIVVIKHDVQISSIKTFNESNYHELYDYILVRDSVGGTSHKQVFEYIKELCKKDMNISCYIGISDLESDILKNQHLIPAHLPVFWLCPDKNYNELLGQNIRGQKILVNG